MAPTTISNGYSYEYQNLVRDLRAAFKQLVQQMPFLMSRIAIADEPMFNTKLEWLEDYIAPISYALTTVTDQTHLVIAAGSVGQIKVGSIVRFRTAAGVPRSELMQVTANSGGSLTLTASYGGTTAATKVVGDFLDLVTTPRNEGTDPVVDPGQEPGLEYNYSQIFDTTAKIGGTAMKTRIYGLGDPLDYQVMVAMRRLIYEMNSSIIFGRRVQRTASVQGTFGGILSFMSGGIADTTGGAISTTIINNVLEQIFLKGGYGGRFAILCATNQARKLSALIPSTSTVIQKPDGAFVPLGNAIGQFRSDLPVMDGFTADLIVEPMFPKDQLAIIDLDRLTFVPYVDRAIKDFDATPAGADYYQRRILGEYSLMVKNGSQAHGLATGLTP